MFPALLSNTEQRQVTLRIDSTLLAEAESERPNATRKEAAEELRKIVATVGKPGEPGEHVRCVVSVNMLSEGWDANNVTQILGLRAFGSQLLCEQVVGRGLRRLDYTPDPATGLLTPEYVDIYGVPFSLIPFKGREAGKPAIDDRPKNEVMALPERNAYEIRFPVVEGYTVALERHAIRCDIAALGRIRVSPDQTRRRFSCNLRSDTKRAAGPVQWAEGRARPARSITARRMPRRSSSRSPARSCETWSPTPSAGSRNHGRPCSPRCSGSCRPTWRRRLTFRRAWMRANSGFRPTPRISSASCRRRSSRRAGRKTRPSSRS
ncbi:MAG: hypothetical protein IPO29_09825 [Anaerolineae bacterium]|nr:hypothetical protein [Anaerolineae bacterium]